MAKCKIKTRDCQLIVKFKLNSGEKVNLQEFNTFLGKNRFLKVTEYD